MLEQFLNGRVVLHPGDCRDVLARLEESSIDSCCTDPPYHLTSIVKRFGSPTAKLVRVGDINATNDLKAAHARSAAGFMGKQWDGGDIAFRPEIWAAVLRVLKPGAHMLVFGGTRTFARMAVAIEDAGFEIRDTIAWVYGSGFPKSHDVSKGIDRAAGAEREIVGNKGILSGRNVDNHAFSKGHITPLRSSWTQDITAPATDAARQWAGWGTALKPAMELICVARKPLSEGTIAANVLRWGTGAINVDGCRVGTETELHASQPHAKRNGFIKGFVDGTETEQRNFGRWPANLVLDGSDEVVAAFPDDAPSGGKSGITQHNWTAAGRGGIGIPTPSPRDPDTGSAARFFYTAKADSDDRLGSRHPCVKPLDLICWLIRLICPKGGTVLDPFAGTGTAGEAAFRENMNAVLIEREEEYQHDIRRRMKLVLAGPDERVCESMKTSNKVQSPGPLFDSLFSERSD